jgi:hypothetical protein
MNIVLQNFCGDFVLKSLPLEAYSHFTIAEVSNHSQGDVMFKH